MNQSEIINIESLDIPELEPYRTLRRPVEHLKKRIFVAEGEKVVKRLLTSNLTVISMLMTPEWFENLYDILKSTFLSIPKIYIGSIQLLESIVGYNLHQGIMAVANMPEDLTIEKIITKTKHPFIFVALDNLVNSENVGVVVRNCVGFGADAMLVGETSSSPYLRRSVRNSMGTVFRIPVLHVKSLSQSINQLKNQYNIEIIAAHPHQTNSLYKTHFSGNICIVFGNEGEGISEEILKACTKSIAIPMLNKTDSLNVASASAVFMYEVRKQRECND